MTQATEKQVDQIIDGLVGDVRVGKRYYFFTVTYAYIAKVKKVTPFAIHLDNAWIVSRAGSASDAVTQIVHGKAKPESFESVNAPLFITVQSLVTAIEMQV